MCTWVPFPQSQPTAHGPGGGLEGGENDRQVRHADEGTRRDQRCRILLLRCRYHHHGDGEVANGYLDDVVENEGRLGNVQIKNLETGV